MTIGDRLSKEQKQQLNKIAAKKKRENLSRKDWEDIMGMKRDTYTRKNGAVRRK